MGTAIKEASFESKRDFKLPDGAIITSQSHRISVEEIENGFLLRKSYDIKYILGDDNDTKYEYFNRTWYSKDNPVKVTMPKEKSLADKLD